MSKKFQDAILSKDFTTIDKFINDPSRKILVRQNLEVSLLSFLALVGDADVLRYVLNKPEFANIKLPEDFIYSLFFNDDATKRASILKFLLNERSDIFDWGLTEFHLRAALGDASVLENYNVQDEYIVHDRESFTVLHYAALSGYSISKDPKILAKILEHEDYTIKSGGNSGTTFLFLLSAYRNIDTITDLLDQYPNHTFSIKSLEQAAKFQTMSVLWFLANRHDWSLLKRLLAQDKKTIVDLWMYPHFATNSTDTTLINLLLTNKQWEILEECLLRDPKQYISLTKMIGEERLSDYLARHKQIKILKILCEREEAAKQTSRLYNAYHRKLRELIKSNEITIETLDKLIALGANPDFDYPTNIIHLFSHNRLDIIKHLLTKHHVKISNLKLHPKDGDFITMIGGVSAETRTEFCKWLLEGNRYKEVTEAISVEHLKAMLGQFDLNLQVPANWPTDRYGLTPYHYLWLCGIDAVRDPSTMRKQLSDMPTTYDIITSGTYEGCHLPYVLAQIQSYSTLEKVLEIDENRVYDVTATAIDGTTCLYLLAANEHWDLFMNLWSRDPAKPVLETIPNENYCRERIKLSLIIAERAPALLEPIIKANTNQYVNLNAAFPPNHSYEGITLAFLLAFYQKWNELTFLFDKHQDPINLDARPVNRYTKYGKNNLRQLLKIHQQDELLKRMEKNAKSSQKKQAKAKSTDRKPIVLTHNTDIAKQPLSRQQAIEIKLASLLAGTGLKASYQQQGKKIIITFHCIPSDPNILDHQKNATLVNKKKLMAKLLTAKNLKGNETIAVNVDDATLSASSEGAMYSFFNNAKVLAELSNTSTTCAITTGNNFIDDANLVALALTSEQQEQWQRALVSGFCDALKISDIQWDAEKRCFIIPLTPGEWRVKDYKSSHQAYETYLITASFLEEKIISKIEIFLSGSKDKDRPVFGKTIYQDGCLMIIPYVANIPLLSEIQQSLFTKISKNCQKPESPLAISPKSEPQTPSVATDVADDSPDQAEKSTEADNDLFMVTADNLKEFLKKASVDFEFKFLYEKNRIYKEKQCRKVIFSYHCQGAFFINGQLSVHLLLALQGAFEECMPGFMQVYRNDDMVIVSFNITKAIALNTKQIASLQAGFSEQMASFLQNPIKLASSKDTAKSDTLIKLTLHSLPKQAPKQKKGKAEKVETESEVFATIKSAIQCLRPKVQNNVMYHLNRTKKLKRPSTIPEMEYAYLLHIMQIFGALESRHIENGLFYKFRNLTRHVVDDTQPETACVNLCNKAETLLKILQEYFLPASITHISVSVFARNKSNALEVIRLAVAEFASALETRTLSELKDHAACLNHHQAALANIHAEGIPNKNHPNYTWKRDATLMLCALIGEISREGIYAEIYRIIGHEHDVPYESLANGLYDRYVTEILQIPRESPVPAILSP